MTAIAMKRGAVPPRRKPAVPRRAAAATVALPVSVQVLRRHIAIAFGGLITVTALIMASLAGVPKQLWSDIVRQSADAGFEVRHVEITGTREMGRLPIYDAVLGGASNAMLTADLPAMRNRLLALPWVADASIGRRLPDTLSIQIVERRPVALWQHQRRFTAIDITGQPLTSKNLERFTSLPIVVGAGANTRVREVLALTAAAPTLTDRVDAAILVGGRRWDVKFKTGETLALPDTPAAATAAFKRFASLDGEDRKLLGGKFERFDMRLPGQITVGGPAVKKALDAATKAAAAAARIPKPMTI